MKSTPFSEELMKEVKALQDSIREFCPEIESAIVLEEILENERDEMNTLIEHRIEILSSASEKTNIDTNS